MDIVFTALADSTIRAWYLVFCFAFMVLPMIALTFWYHSNIRETRGGRELMKEQSRVGVWRYLGFASTFHGLHDAGRMAKDIAAGRYGDRVRRMQSRTYWLVGAWLVVNVIAFGLLIWADEVNRTTN